MIIEFYIKKLFVGRYIIQGYFYLRMYFEVELSEFLIILRCFNMEIKFGLNKYLKIIILQMKILKLKKICF